MYILNHQLLEPADILLIRSNSAVSIRVRAATNSQYSHAMLYVGLSSYIDSDSPGVQSNNIQRKLFEDENDLKILRLKEKTSQTNLINIINFARKRIGTAYSLEEAKLALSADETVEHNPNRQFCTRFIAQAYNSVGLSLTENSDYCVPEDLLKSDLLVEISDVIRKATESEIEFAASESPLKTQAEIHNHILREARRISGEDIQTLDQLNNLIIKLPEYDEQITQIVGESGYLTMMDEDAKRNPWHYDSVKFIEHYEDPKRILGAVIEIEAIEIPMRDAYKNALFTMTKLHAQYPLKFLKQEMDLYERLIGFSNQRLLTISEAYNYIKNQQ